MLILLESGVDIQRSLNMITEEQKLGSERKRILNQVESDLIMGNSLATSFKLSGNISNLVTSIQGLTTLGSRYEYDQLNRLKSADYYAISSTFNNSWQNGAQVPGYGNTYNYDRNGNLSTLTRRDNAGNLFDDFTYNYTAGTNQLSHVTDAVGTNLQTSNLVEDIKSGQSAGNYTYDKLGQLLSDVQETTNLTWRLGDKKLQSQTYTNTSNNRTDRIDFEYNPFGQRILKIVSLADASGAYPQADKKYTYYAYDANGMVMEVYDLQMGNDESTRKASVKEIHLYGASRIGMINPLNLELYNAGLVSPATSPYSKHLMGRTTYEITNYLGNVNAVISDKKLNDAPPLGSTTFSYKADVLEFKDYYPFGMVMDDRKSIDAAYRYGYNGMEMDNEAKGNGNSYDYGARMYDPRLGRWLSLDPLAKKYPSIAPYTFVANNPIIYVDPDGRDIIDFLVAMGLTTAQAQATIVQGSTVFISWLAQYADVTSGDESNALGFVTSGSRSNINLCFNTELAGVGELGSCMITYKGTPLNECDPSELVGASSDDFKLEVNLAVLNDNDNTTLEPYRAGVKLLTILHETGLHAESQSLLLLCYLNGDKSEEEFIDDYISLVCGGGEHDHLKITSESGDVYEAMVEDAKMILQTGFGNIPYKELRAPEKSDLNGQDIPWQDRLKRDYGETSPERAFNGFRGLFLDDLFKKEYRNDQEHYDPGTRGNSTHGLPEIPCEVYKEGCIQKGNK